MEKLPRNLNYTRTFPRVHDIFHVSQLRLWFKDPIREVEHETLDLQADLSYREYPVHILDPAKRAIRCQKIKFLKVQWSHHYEKEATWEREDRLHAEYPTFLPTTSESRDEILLSGGELSQPQVRYVLGSSLTLHTCQNFQKEIEMGKIKAPNEFIQMATLKVAPKIPLVFLKSPINECDHISSDVDSNPFS